ncbi:hypothetical protein O0Q50_20065 [Priestia aryabhattai]|uniref:Uncharacterized protein n=1 Tax=Priestia aryabhattai TaxID=412384 RepID=A0AAX6NDA4_PRIAR|nr:hypothetical protein [Priestia aryabhattai]MDU9693474.1 hypothetical protein [Priestia aryabhattai]
MNDKLLEEAEKVDFKQIDKESLVSMLYFSEEFYSSAKEFLKVFAHILTYFFVTLMFAIYCCFHASYIEKVPLIIAISVKAAIVLYAIYLVRRGIIMYRKHEVFLRVLLQYIIKAKTTLNKKD